MQRLIESRDGTRDADSKQRIGTTVLWSGDDARAKLRDPNFLDAWNELAAACPFATPFQSADFAIVWFETYAARYDPILIATVADDGSLDALIALAREGDDPRKYVLPDVPMMTLRTDGTIRTHARVAVQARPLWRIEETAVQSSLRKKSNKSKLNRLKRARTPTLDGRAVSAHIGAINGEQTHLAIVAHDPSLADLSPGKMHLLLLAQKLSEDRRPLFDLSPGGDSWKKRFTTDREEAFTLTWYDRPRARSRAVLLTQGRTVVRDALRSSGLHEPIRSLRATLAPPPGRSALSALWSDDHIRVYVAPRCAVDAMSTERHEGALENAPETLVRYSPRIDDPTRQAFLRSALANLESGALCYAAGLDTRLPRCGWRRSVTVIHLSELGDPIELDGESGVLFDFLPARGEGADDAYRSMISRMSIDALQATPEQPVYLVASNDRLNFSTLIRDLGFVPFAGASRTRRFGRVRRSRVS